MTQIEISKYLDIPFATLNDWKQEDSNRNKLYELLSNLDTQEVGKILNKKNNTMFKIKLKSAYSIKSVCAFFLSNK